MKTFLLCCCLGLLAPFVYAQSYLYPVKEGHLWGFMNKRGKVKIAPRYDFIAPTTMEWFAVDKKDNSDYRLVELKGQLGVIDKGAQEVLPCQYAQIRILDDEYFAVKQNPEDNFVIINRAGEVQISATYRRIRFLAKNPENGNTFFLVGNNTHWGIHQGKGELIVPIKYDDIKSVAPESDLFLVHSKRVQRQTEWKESKFWALIDSKGAKILEQQYTKIKYYSPDFIGATLRKGKYAAFNRKGEEIYPAEYQYFRPLNAHFMEMRDCMQVAHLYSFSKKKILDMGNRYRVYEPFDKHFIKARIEGERIRVLLDTTGKEVIPASATFSDISLREDSLLRVSQTTDFRYRHGLWDLDSGLVLPCQYSGVGKVNRGHVEVGLYGVMGLVNFAGDTIVPLTFDTLRWEGNFVKGFKGKTIKVYEFNENNEVIGFDSYEGGISINISKKNAKSYQIAKKENRRATIEREDYYLSLFEPVSQIQGSDWQWRWDKTRGVFITNQVTYRNNERVDISSRTPYPIYPVKVSHILNTRHTALYSAYRPIFNPLFAKLELRAGKAYRMALFSHQEGKEITQYEYLGIRRTDFERRLPLAAVMDTLQRFALIDTLGNKRRNQNGQPAYFSYIGEFIDGYARAAIGGTLAELKDYNNVKYKLLSGSAFVRIMGMKSKKNREPKIEIWLQPLDSIPPLWGVIDSVGNWVIDPSYDYIRDNVEGQFVAVKDGKWGLIDKDEKEILPFKYARVTKYFDRWKINDVGQSLILFNRRGHQLNNGDFEKRGIFKEGLCAVRKNGKWGYVNAENDLVIDYQYQSANHFSESKALVKTNDKWLIINKLGESISEVNTSLDTIFSFKNHYCIFKKGHLQGLINEKGEEVIAPKFHRINPVEFGVARIMLKGKMGLVDTTGKMLVPPTKYLKIEAFDKEEKLASILVNSGRGTQQGFINTKGEVIVEPTYRVVESFYEGLAAVSDGYYYGMIDRTGQVQIPFRYYNIRYLGKGMFLGQTSGSLQWAFFNKKGKVLAKKGYEFIGDFSNDKAFVKIDANRKGLINRKGKLVQELEEHITFYKEGILGTKEGNKSTFLRTNGEAMMDLEFDETNPFQDGLALVRYKYRLGVVNKRGMFVVPPKYFLLNQLADAQIEVGPPAFGIADKAGEIVIDCIYDNVTLMEGGIYKVEQGEAVGYVKENGEVVHSLQF